MALRPLLAPALLGVLAVLLTGCVAVGPQQGYLTLTGSDAVALPPCGSPDPVPVAALATDVPAECEPAGQALVFPGGEQVQLPAETIGTGAQVSASGVVRSYVGVGRYGIVAAESGSGCSEVREWGTAEGLRRVHAAFGPEWMCG
ncbi:hypothetical protein DEJ23_02790 [Curtobacterium sp. MCSS17_008]|uniref:hypothetical protein n=1 Tax=Curtobacterium sp. MCSS17_008 TaxID=2175647 RepID=UPI000DA91C60|nr:hypothetical protein [Curtobacterium sp. MCSS17_008]PZF58750.1 hypothetical protein DEJ23_02790 [Curtobacterium sp. MCSS17_008]